MKLNKFGINHRLTNRIPQDTLKRMEIRQSTEFRRWLHHLKDTRAKAAIEARLDACAIHGRPIGDIKSVGGSISEMRFHTGAGYRVYYTIQGNVLILLLIGGDKSTQQADIEQARKIFNEYKEQQ
ncbi:addiction module killer protein [Bifidobacterium goeldii]|uniref:Addiction module killer protein n=1 Tax=Bifidobacterium goeldii TaxID=2306975 RepID=A0A430FKU7_9BIFI|nr:type II toxin-antitoxin system RelE/ParE family toxin [Bifidobacterium goeldii]RSX53410.1 addiction module killer protein [Bifidobacterium goeldii]